jgi:hypothetical protein
VKASGEQKPEAGKNLKWMMDGIAGGDGKDEGGALNSEP